MQIQNHPRFFNLPTKYIGNGIRTLPPTINRFANRCDALFIDQITHILSRSSFEQIIDISKNALQDAKGHFTGFDKLSFIFEKSKIDTGMWALDYLDRDIKFGPIPKDEFDTFIKPKRYEFAENMWRSIICHDTNNCIAPLFYATQYMLRENVSEKESTKTLLSNLYDHCCKVIDTVKEAANNDISIGEFLRTIETTMESIKSISPNLKKIAYKFNPKIPIVIDNFLKRLPAQCSIYRNYEPENILIISGDEKNETNIKEAVNFLINKREHPSITLAKIMDLWLKRREIEGGLVFDRNWGAFLKSLTDTKYGKDIYEEAIIKNYSSNDLVQNLTKELTEK